MEYEFNGQTIVVEEISDGIQFDIAKSDQTVITNLLAALKFDGYTDIEPILKAAMDIAGIDDNVTERQAGMAIAKAMPLVAYHVAKSADTARLALSYMPAELQTVLLLKTANKAPVQAAKSDMLKAAKAGDVSSTAYAGLMSDDREIQKTMKSEGGLLMQELTLFKGRYPELVSGLSDAQIVQKYFTSQ